MPEVRKVEAGKLLCVEETGSYWKLSLLFGQLQEFLQARRVPAKGECLAIIYDLPATANPERLHYAAAVELAGEITGNGEITVIIQPAGWVACETCRGPWEGRPEVYRRLAAWAEEQGYRINGPAREFFLESVPKNAEDYSQALIEVQLPVEKGTA